MKNIAKPVRVYRVVMDNAAAALGPNKLRYVWPRMSVLLREEHLPVTVKGENSPSFTAAFPSFCSVAR